jgi:hypothetical protein
MTGCRVRRPAQPHRHEQRGRRPHGRRAHAVLPPAPHPAQAHATTANARSMRRAWAGLFPAESSERRSRYPALPYRACCGAPAQPPPAQGFSHGPTAQDTACPLRGCSSHGHRAPHHHRGPHGLTATWPSPEAPPAARRSPVKRRWPPDEGSRTAVAGCEQWPEMPERLLRAAWRPERSAVRRCSALTPSPPGAQCRHPCRHRHGPAAPAELGRAAAAWEAGRPGAAQHRSHLRSLRAAQRWS